MGYAFTTYSTEGLLRQLKNQATIDNSKETKLQQLIGPKHGTGNRKKRGK